MSLVTLYRPALDELEYRQRLLADPATMEYNRAWGGTIDFPRERWAEWYARWVEDTSGQRFYRYLYDEEEDMFVGEVAYHFDHSFGGCVCDVIVSAACRGRGYGGQGLLLLCEAARENGVTRICDNIGVNNPSVSLFLSEGFREISRNEEYILVVRDLSEEPG